MVTCESPRIAWRARREDRAPIEDWTRFIRTADAYYGRLATERGEPYVQVSADEIDAAAALAVALGVTPADAVAWLPVAARR